MTTTNTVSERPLVLHVKTALSEDDAQICVAPNLAWAALAEGRSVTIVFDASALTSIAKNYGWRSLVNGDSNALDRASLPKSERETLSRQFGVAPEEVPTDYGQYLSFLRSKGVELYYNKTMTVLYKIDESQIHTDVKPLELKGLLQVLSQENADYIVY
jgi:hypothetical protein